MGFNIGFEKVSGILGAVGGAASKVLGTGIKAFGKATGSGSGALGALSAGFTGDQFIRDYKKNKNLALGAMQRG